MKLKNLRLFGGRGIRSFSFWLTLGAAVIDIFAVEPYVLVLFLLKSRHECPSPYDSLQSPAAHVVSLRRGYGNTARSPSYRSL